MKKTIRNALLLLGGICLAATLGLNALLMPPFRSGVLPGTETTASVCGEGDKFSLVILADESIPRNRLDPLARMVQKSGGTSYLLRQTEDLEPLRRFAENSNSSTLLFTYGAGWENALRLLERSDHISSTVILSPVGEFDPSGLSVQSPVMLLGTSSDQAPTSERLTEIYNALSGEKIAPNGLSYTSQSGNLRLRVVSASLDAYQTFSDSTLATISDWYRDSAGIQLAGPESAGALRLASWALGFGALILLLVALYHLLSDEMLDVGYSLLSLNVTSPVRFSLLKGLSFLPALALLALPALLLLILPLPGLTPIPALFCGYFGCLGLFSLLLIRLGKMPGVAGPLSFPSARPNRKRVLTGLGAGTAVLLIVGMLSASGLYTLRLSLEKIPAFLLCAAAAGLGTAGWLSDSMLLDQCKHPLWLRISLDLLPFLPYAGLAFLAIPAFGFTGFYTTVLLLGALTVNLLLARLLRLILGTVWLPSAVSGLLMGIFSAFSIL